MTLDITTYLPYLDDTDLSPSQKEAIIRTVWGLMESQVVQAFEQEPQESKPLPINKQ